MVMSGPIKRHGGKCYLAKRIVGLMPPHTHYVEPFFGGGAVLLARDPEGVSEVANDLDGDLTCFWRVLQSGELFPLLRRRLEATPFSEAEWDAAREFLARRDVAENDILGGEVDRAWAFFVCARQSLAGRTKSFTGVTKTRTRRGMNNEVSAWLSAVEGLPEVHARLKRVLILNQPAVEVVRSQDGPGTLFYCDPPYVHSSRTTSGEYAHEMSDDGHAKLIQVLSGIKGKFILSGYHSVLYDEVAAKHKWRVVEFTIDNKSSHQKVKPKKTECLWMNYH